MWRPDEVVMDLACGARLVLRLVVDPAECRDRDGLCPTADHLAAQLWAFMHVETLDAASAKQTDRPKGERDA